MTTQQPDLAQRSYQPPVPGSQGVPPRPVVPMSRQHAPVRPAAPLQPSFPQVRPLNAPPQQVNAPPRPPANYAQRPMSPYSAEPAPLATPSPQSPMDALSSATANMNLQTPPHQPTAPMQQATARSTKPRRVYAPMTPPPSSDTPRPQQCQQPAAVPPQQVPPPTTAAPQPMPQQQQQQPGSPYPPRKQQRINPDHIPSPVQIRLQDQELYNSEPYATCSQEPIPLATTAFKTIDQGNCNPRFMRTTLRELPRSYDLTRDTHLPFGLVVQPLAACHPEDEPVLVAKTGPDGPVRCTRCKAYINPWCRFTDGGRKFICNLCGFFNDVPEVYFSNLDMTGQRVDLAERPELQRGTIEFQVPQIYWTRQPCPLHVLFAIDVSWNAIKSGMVASVCAAIAKSIFDEKMRGKRVAIMTFDTTAHFYNLNGEEAQMLVIPDINDMFLPMSEDSLFVDPHGARSIIEALLSNLPQMYAENQATTAALGSAVKAGLIGLKATGGKIHLFQSVLPTMGPGALKSRDDQKLHNTEKERQLFAPQDTLYNVMGKECVELGVCVDLWLFPPTNTYTDVSTLGALPALTGGDTHYFANFDASNDESTLARQLLHSLIREQGYNAAMRVRCSNGFSVEDQFGNFYMNNSTDVEFGGIDADKAVAFTFRHDSRLDEKEGFIQCALLYTTTSGERRVRIHNLRLPVTSEITNLFKSADMDTSMNLLCKQVISQASKRIHRELASQLDGECTRILAAYRKHCASSASSGQLILPEALKAFPVYTSALRKNPGFRKTMGSIDYKVYCMRRLKSMGVQDTALWLYPRIIPLDIYVTENGSATTLPMERLSYERLRTNGIYYLQSPHIRYIWIGRDVAADTLQRVLGITNLNEQKPSKVHPQVQTLLDTSPLAPLRYIRQSVDMELPFAIELVEDEVYDEASYVDYLCTIHRMIQSEIEREKRDNFVANASYWAYRY